MKNEVMERIPISIFQDACSRVLDHVRTTGQPVLITRYGEPIAQISPPPSAKKTGAWLGSLRKSGKIVGDILDPALDENEWEILQR